jgi:hypothetical protein
MSRATRLLATDRLASAVEGDRYPSRGVDLVRRFQDAVSMVKVAEQTPVGFALVQHSLRPIAAVR